MAKSVVTCEGTFATKLRGETQEDAETEKFYLPVHNESRQAKNKSNFI